VYPLACSQKLIAGEFLLAQQMNRRMVPESELLEIAQLCFSGGNRVCGDPSNQEAPLHFESPCPTICQIQEDFS
jgi:hypothetical protein